MKSSMIFHSLVLIVQVLEVIQGTEKKVYVLYFQVFDREKVTNEIFDQDQKLAGMDPSSKKL